MTFDLTPQGTVDLIGLKGIFWWGRPEYDAIDPVPFLGGLICMYTSGTNWHYAWVML